MSRNWIVYASAVALAAAPCTLGVTHVYDFESETATSVPRIGGYTSLSMTSGGLTVTLKRSGGAAFDVVLNVGGQSGKPAGWATKSLDPFFTLPGDSWIANFSSPIVAFSAETGDYGADSDSPVSMSAYSGLDGTGALVDSDVGIWDAGTSFPAFLTMSVAGAGINSVTFTSNGSFPNSLFWDNFKAETSTVPEGGSALALLSSALAALWGFRTRMATR